MLLSTGQIQAQIMKQTGQPLTRDAVSYAIRRLGIEPLGRCGLVRVFPSSVIEEIQRFLATKRRGSTGRDSSNHK